MRTATLVFILASIVASTVTACSIGGGPFVGYGTKHGLVYGAEVGAGVPFGQLTLGMQNHDLVSYLRFDIVAASSAFETDDRVGVGVRVGGGYGWGRSRSGGVFTLGPNVGYALRPLSCTDWGFLGFSGIELRSVGGETQVVATTRVDGMRKFCFHNF